MSKAVEELREWRTLSGVELDQTIDAVIAELEECNEQRLAKTRELVVATLKLSDCEKQLAAVTSELEITSKHRDNAVDELRYGAVETLKQLDAVSEKVINDLKAQLAAVTEDRGKWEAVAKANQDEIDRFQKHLDSAHVELKECEKELGELKGKHE